MKLNNDKKIVTTNTVYTFSVNDITDGDLPLAKLDTGALDANHMLQTDANKNIVSSSHVFLEGTLADG